MVFLIIKFIIIGIFIIGILSFTFKNRRKSLENDNEVVISKGKWKNQFHEIKNKRLSEEKGIKQAELKVMEEHRKISERLWPRISEVCRGFALATGFEYKEELVNALRGHEVCFSTSIIDGYVGSITIGLMTECYRKEHLSYTRKYGRFGDNLCRSLIYINGDIRGKYTEEIVIPVNKFTEELLVTKLRGLVEV